MTRAWDEWAATVFDVLAPRHVLLLLLVATAATALLWYFFPAWVPRRLPRLDLPRWRRRSAPVAARDGGRVADPAPVGSVPPGDGSVADRLAAQGRYAEAVRERLRVIVGDLVGAGVVAPDPGWTAVELSAAASVARPAVARPLGDATALFSDVWYGPRPALPGHDARMRELTGEVRAALTGDAPTGPGRRP